MARKFRSELSRWFKRADVSYRDIDGRRKYRSIADIHILFLCEPPSPRILSLIQAYLERYWDISRESFGRILGGHDVDFVLEDSYEAYSRLELRLNNFYMNSWGLRSSDKANAGDLLTSYSQLDQCLRFLRRQHGGMDT